MSIHTHNIINVKPLILVLFFTCCIFALDINACINFSYLTLSLSFCLTCLLIIIIYTTWLPHSPFHHYHHLTASPDDPKSSSPPGYTVSTTTVSACCSPPTVGVTSPPPFAAQASGGGGGQSALVSSYPAVLVGRSADVKSKVPPPVPPRGTPKQKRGGGGKGGPPAVYDLVATNGHLLHDLLCLSDTNPCCIGSDITEHGFTAVATTTAAAAATATFHSPLSTKSSATTLPTARLDSHAEVVNNLSDTNMERIASVQAKPLARYSNYEDLQVATGATTAAVVLVDRSISVQEDRQAALQPATMKTKRSHSEADKYVQRQHQLQPLEGRFMNRFKRRRNLHTLSLKQTSRRDDSTQSAVHSISSNDNAKQVTVHSSQQQVYGAKVKQLRGLFDQRNSNVAVPLKCNVNFRGTRPYMDRQRCQVPQIIVTGTPPPVHEQPSQIDRELSLRHQYGHEVYNSKRPQQQQSSCSEYVGDLV